MYEKVGNSTFFFANDFLFPFKDNQVKFSLQMLSDWMCQKFCHLIKELFKVSSLDRLKYIHETKVYYVTDWN